MRTNRTRETRADRGLTETCLSSAVCAFGREEALICGGKCTVKAACRRARLTICCESLPLAIQWRLNLGPRRVSACFLSGRTSGRAFALSSFLPTSRFALHQSARTATAVLAVLLLTSCLRLGLKLRPTISSADENEATVLRMEPGYGSHAV